MSLTELALLRAGAPSLAEFQRRTGLPPTGTADILTQQALFPWLTGFAAYRVASGDSYARIAADFGTDAAAISTANPNQDPRKLQIGQLLTVPYGFELVTAAAPMSYALLQLTLQGLKARYPFLTLNAITETRWGRKLPQIAVGRGAKRVLFNASHHANEWITTPLLLRFLERYARAVAENGTIYGYRARSLYQSTTLHLVPMVNPDGVELVTGALPPESAAYKQALRLAESYPGIPFPQGWKANLQGVDLNLNYPAGWEQARRNKFAQGYTRPGPRDYVGSAPLDQPESAAMAELTERVRPALTLSYHTQGELIFWKYLDVEPPGGRALAEEFAAASGYAVEEVPYASGFAGYKDWFILKWNRPGYTIEAGRGENPLPLSELDEMYRRNEGILTLALAR